ncbi:MAG: NTP transferase domain-containing protein [Phycisphaeraceae bacterium]|nr:NTP transferase domain-containing protein [Phycisphaeraceae bacterium]
MTVSTDHLAAIILAAGKGTRMGGDLPKVVHPVGGRPMICPIVDACLAAGVGRIIVVVGYKQEMVRDALRQYKVEFAVQAEQHGTGHAVLCAKEALGTNAHDTLILAGDGPLIRASTLGTLIVKHRTSGAAATLATSIIDDPTGYGRIVRDSSGAFREIVEHKNATADQRAIKEVNPSYYCFRRAELLSALAEVTPNPVSGELYLTDTLSILLRHGKRVEVVPAVPPEDILSINTPAELAVVDRLYRQRETRHASPSGARA